MQRLKTGKIVAVDKAAVMGVSFTRLQVVAAQRLFCRARRTRVRYSLNPTESLISPKDITRKIWLGVMRKRLATDSRDQRQAKIFPR